MGAIRSGDARVAGRRCVCNVFLYHPLTRTSIPLRDIAVVCGGVGGTWVGVWGMEDRKAQFDAAFKRLASDVASTLAMENALSGKATVKVAKTRSRTKKSALSSQSISVDPEPRDPLEILDGVLVACKRKRREMAEGRENTVSPELLNRMACFTDKFKLSPYQNFMHYVPRVVNVVTVSAHRHPEGRCIRPTAPRPTRAPSHDGVNPCVRSSQRPSPCRAAARSCRSTCTRSPRAAKTLTMRPRSSARCSWPTPSLAAACWFSVSCLFRTHSHTQCTLQYLQWLDLVHMVLFILPPLDPGRPSLTWSGSNSAGRWRRRF